MRAPKWAYPTLVLYQSPSQYSLGVLANTRLYAFPCRTAYSHECPRMLRAAFTWRVVPFRFSRAPWIWFREHEVSNPRPS